MRADRQPPARSALVALAAACAVLAAACGPVVELEPVGPLKLAEPELTSRVLAADGTQLATLHAEQDRELVSLDDVPDVLRDAVIATEDARFYTHGGVDARAIARAVAVNARTGEVRQGGSTITQQLAKNAVVGSDPTLERKLAEAATALRIERELTKDEILERYLNTVYFGNGAYGVSTAAQRYFGVALRDLGLAQAALLAALLKAPATYDPYTHPDRARQRRNLVLRLMERHGHIDAGQARDAAQDPLAVTPLTGRDWTAPWFVDHVLAALQHDPEFAVLGDSPTDRAAQIFRGGLEITTTLRPEWQHAAEQAVDDTLFAPDDPHAAVVAIDPTTGGIAALIGGRVTPDDTQEFSRFNLATDGRRQPGSAFKPLVLATALAQGYTLDDTFPGGSRVVLPPQPGEPTPYPVRNYDDRDYGEVTLRDATAHSVNVVYARLAADVGPDNVVATAHKAGIRSDLPALRSIALGTAEVSPLEMASMAATLAAGGVYRPPSAVTKITTADGTVLYERGAVKGRRAMQRGVAYLVTDALAGVVRYGTGERADLQRPVAGKTGTTQNGADAWFVGYTPHLAASVWVGYPQGAVAMEPPRTRITVEGGNWPAEIFAQLGLRALVETPAEDFDRPGVELVTAQVDYTRNCLPNPYTPGNLIVEREYISGTEPTDICTEPTGPDNRGLSVDVPDVIGMPIELASRVLAESGLAVVRHAEPSLTLPPGYIARQQPPGGAISGSGGTVHVWVSTAETALAVVPDVVGLDVVDARLALEEAGFAVAVTRACPDTGCESIPAAEVWQQSPRADEEVTAHSAVRITATPD